MQVMRHPEIPVLVREDGWVELPDNPTKKGGWTQGTVDRRGYRKVGVYGRYYYVHRLVAELFVPNPGNLPFVAHANRDTGDNRAENLKWVSVKDVHRYTRAYERVASRGWPHSIDDPKAYERARLRALADGSHTPRQPRPRKVSVPKAVLPPRTHRVMMADGKRRYVTETLAKLLLQLPVKERL